jgi:hypothetical protein
MPPLKKMAEQAGRFVQSQYQNLKEKYSDPPPQQQDKPSQKER